MTPAGSWARLRPGKRSFEKYSISLPGCQSPLGEDALPGPCLPGRPAEGRRRERISAGSNLNLTLATAIRHPSASRVGRAEERTSPPGGVAGIPAARSGAAPPGDGLFVPVWAFFGGRSGQNAGRSGPAGEWRDREGNPGDGFRGAGPADRAGPRPFFKNILPERQNVLRLLYRNTAKTGWKRQKTA